MSRKCSNKPFCPFAETKKEEKNSVVSNIKNYIDVLDRCINDKERVFKNRLKTLEIQKKTYLRKNVGSWQDCDPNLVCMIFLMQRPKIWIKKLPTSIKKL